MEGNELIMNESPSPTSSGRNADLLYVGAWIDSNYLSRPSNDLRIPEVKPGNRERCGAAAKDTSIALPSRLEVVQVSGRHYEISQRLQSIERDIGAVFSQSNEGPTYDMSPIQRWEIETAHKQPWLQWERLQALPSDRKEKI